MMPPTDEYEDCEDCQGTGIGDPHAQTPCPSCGGRGYPKPEAEPDEEPDEYEEYKGEEVDW